MSDTPLSDFERGRLHRYYVPEKALDILARIDYPEYRVMFINEVITKNEDLTEEKITEHYNKLDPKTVRGYKPPGESVGPQQSRNSRQAGPAPQTQANQGRPRDNEGSQTGATVGGMSAHFGRLGLNDPPSNTGNRPSNSQNSGSRRRARTRSRSPRSISPRGDNYRNRRDDRGSGGSRR